MVSIKGAPKKKKPRPARITKAGKALIPQWDGWEGWSGEKFHTFRRHSHDWYYRTFKATDMHPHLFQWMLMQEEYTKSDITSLKALPNWKIQHGLGINAKLLLDGMPAFNPKEAEHWESLPGTQGTVSPVTDYMNEKLATLIEEGSKIVVEKKVEEKSSVYVPTIQERIHTQAVAASADIDEWLEGFVNDRDSFDPKGFDFKQHFGKQGVTQAHARKMKVFFESELTDFKDLERMPTAGQLKKMDELEADMWEQLKEGYDHLKKADIKKYTLAIQELLLALDFVIESAKATRAPRKAKPKSADKLVAKLKFNKVDDKYKLASVRPEDIIGTNELWVFNVKTRKLGKYIASNIDPKGQGRAGTGLQVKGTTITGFDEKLSVQKTLRKPDIQLKQFKDCGKVKLRTFLDDIPTTDTKLNGRCNLDTILLKLN